MVVNGHKLIVNEEIKLSKDDIIEARHVSEMKEAEKAIYDNYIDHFTCIQCKYIVKNPKECKQCSSTICQDCITLVKSDSDSCKHTNADSFQKINKFLLRILETFEFKCSQCTKSKIEFSGSYNEVIEHLTHCPS